MKTLLRHPLRTSAFLLSALPGLVSHAATLYWDTNGATDGAGATANGNWNTTAGNNVWSTSSAGDIATQVYVANSDVVFAAGTDMASATVTLTGAASANRLTVEEGSLAITGTATLTVGNGGITLNSGVGTVDIARLILGSSTTPGTVAVTLNTDASTPGSSLTLGSATAPTRNGVTLFRGANLGVNTAGANNSSNVFFGTAPTLTGAGASGTTSVGIIAHATYDASASGSGSDFVTYDTNGVRSLTSSEYSSTVTAGTNVKVTGAVTNTGATTINSLIIGAGGGISGGTSIAVTSGDILVAGGANNGITTALSTSAGSLYINAIENLTAAGISGGGVVNKFGAGTASFTTIDGSVNVNEGTLVVNGGNKTKTVAINGGTFRIGASNSVIDGNSVTVNSNGTFELSSGVTDTINVLSGNGTLTGGSGSVLTVGNTTGTGTFAGSITGGIALVKTGTGTLTLGGAITTTGSTTVSAGTATLDTASIKTFYIGANGVTNGVTGAGTANFNGTFAFDLSGASLVDGNSWTIANVTTQSFSASFAVSGFTENANIWTNGAGLTFSEATGILSYSAIPEPSSFAMLGGLSGLVAAGLRRRHRR